MSGLEVIGVVLGVIPLLISGLEHYKDGLVPIKDMIKYEYVVKEYIRALNVARCRLRNTCEKLLSGFVEDGELALLLDFTSLDGGAWKKPDLDRKLRERLDQSYEGYMATVAHLAQTMFAFAKKMGLDSKFRPAWIEKPSKKRTRDVIFGDDIKRKSAKLWKRVKLGLDHDEFDELIKDMAHENQQLEILTQGNLDLEPIRKERIRDMDTKYWSAVRHFATRLYNSLMLHWPCQCRISHKASLRLDIRANSRDWNNVEVEFGVVFFSNSESENEAHSAPWYWRDTEIRCVEIAKSQSALPLLPARPSQGRNVSFGSLPSPPVSRTPSPALRPTSAKIEDLCSALARKDIESCCLGYLDDENWQHHVYLSAQGLSGHSPQHAVSLHQILAGKISPDPVIIKPKDRYEVALLLSSTVLQLHSTPWLNDNWTRDDIYLLSGYHEKTIAKNIYVSKTFPASQVQFSAESDPEMALLRNVSVFNLGLALLELTFGRPIEYYECEKDLRDGERTVMTDRLIAERLMGQIEDYEGKRYSDVVYRCIYCDFGSRVTSFDNDEFRQNFYTAAVVPLEGILIDFTR